MSLKETSGNILNIGDKVRMNIPAIKASMEEYGSDGIEFTSTGKNYWKYIQEHPDEVYTIIGLDFDYDDIYILSGFMSDTTWGSDELICIPEPQTNFELIKNMDAEEMATQLFPLLAGICEDGIPSQELMLEWLNRKPVSEENQAGEGGDMDGRDNAS